MENSIIISPESEYLIKKINILKNKIIELIIERNELLYKKNHQILVDYMSKIGHIEDKIRDIQSEYIKIQGTIKLIILRSAFNKTSRISILENLINKKTEEAKEKKEKPKETSNELKNTYRRIIKMIHPDSCENDTDDILLCNVINAYEHENLNALKDIEELLNERKDPFNMCSSILETEYMHLTDKYEDIRNSIQSIKASFPFNQEKLLSNEKKIKKRQIKLENTLKEEKDKLEKIKDELRYWKLKELAVATN